jgi:uncharacterized protein YbaR (Trm112 family)
MACAPFANSGGDPWFGPNLSARHFDSEEILAVKGVGEMIALTTDAAAMFLSWLDTRDSGLLQKALEHPGRNAFTREILVCTDFVQFFRIQDPIPVKVIQG